MRVLPATSPMTVNFREHYKRDRVVSGIIEGSRAVHRTEEPASRTNQTGTHNDIELEHEASLQREFARRIASPSEGVRNKVRRRFFFMKKKVSHQHNMCTEKYLQ